MYLISRLVILIVFTLWLIPSSFAQQNFVMDSSFEESPHTSWGDWKDWGPSERDFDNTEKTHSGTQTYKITITDSASRWNSDIVLQDDITGIQGGDKFEASAYLLNPKDNSLSDHVEVYLELIFFDGKGKDTENEVGKSQSKKYGCGKPQDQWLKLAIKETAPQGAKTCKLQLVVLPVPYLSDNQKADEKYSGIIYFDDVSLVKK